MQTNTENGKRKSVAVFRFMCKLVQKEKEEKKKRTTFFRFWCTEIDKVDVPPEKGCPFLRITQTFQWLEGSSYFQAWTTPSDQCFYNDGEVFLSVPTRPAGLNGTSCQSGQVLFLIDDAPKFKLVVWCDVTQASLLHCLILFSYFSTDHDLLWYIDRSGSLQWFF